jgi:hypothetical protein
MLMLQRGYQSWYVRAARIGPHRGLAELDDCGAEASFDGFFCFGFSEAPTPSAPAVVHTVRVLSERFRLGESLLVSTPALLASVGVLQPALSLRFFPA